jgi:putative membrane protein
MAEVELGELAADKAQNAEVKKFAQMMIADHTKANAELKTLAAKNNVTLPTELSAKHQSMKQKLQGLSGAEFDKAYVDGQVEDHEDTLELMENNTDNSNADIKAFATKTQPIIKAHLDMIKNIQSKMK